MLLTGTFVRSVDEKQRIALPKRFRDVLQKAGAEALYVTPGTDGSLAIYTESALATLAQRMAAMSPTQQDVRAFNRLFYAQAELVELDSQGRFRLPASLAQLAHLGREAVLVGVNDHLELWDRERWDRYLAEKSAQYDSIAERAFGQTEPPPKTP